MKKITFILLTLLFASSLFAEIKFDMLWEQREGSASFDSDDFGYRIACNGDSLYVSTIKGAEGLLAVYNAETGNYFEDAVENYIFSETVNLSNQPGDVVVDSKGAIYVTGRDLGAIYKYDNSNAVPVKFFSNDILRSSFCATFDLFLDENGDGCLVTCSAMPSTDIYYFPIASNEVSGSYKSFKHPGSLGTNPAISIVSPDTFWVDCANNLPARFVLKDNKLSSAKIISSPLISPRSTGVEQFEYNGKTYLACTATGLAEFNDVPKSSAALFELNTSTLEVTPVSVSGGGNYFPDGGLGSAKNTYYDYQDIAVDVRADGAYIYFMTSANGMVAYKLYDDAPVSTEPVNVSTVEELKANPGVEVLFSDAKVLKSDVDGSLSFESSDVKLISETDVYYISDLKGVYDAKLNQFVVNEVVSVKGFYTYADFFAFVSTLNIPDYEMSDAYFVKEGAIVSFDIMPLVQIKISENTYVGYQFVDDSGQSLETVLTVGDCLSDAMVMFEPNSEVPSYSTLYFVSFSVEHDKPVVRKECSLSQISQQMDLLANLPVLVKGVILEAGDEANGYNDNVSLDNVTVSIMNVESFDLADYDGKKVNLSAIVSYDGDMLFLIVQDIVVESTSTDVESVESVSSVFVRNGEIIVSAAVGSVIEVYNVHGQRLYASEALSETTVINTLNSGMVIVRVNNEVHKAILR